VIPSALLTALLSSRPRMIVAVAGEVQGRGLRRAGGLRIEDSVFGGVEGAFGVLTVLKLGMSFFAMARAGRHRGGCGTAGSMGAGLHHHAVVLELVGSEKKTMAMGFAQIYVTVITSYFLPSMACAPALLVRARGLSDLGDFGARVFRPREIRGAFARLAAEQRIRVVSWVGGVVGEAAAMRRDSAAADDRHAAETGPLLPSLRTERSSHHARTVLRPQTP